MKKLLVVLSFYRHLGKKIVGQPPTTPYDNEKSHNYIIIKVYRTQGFKKGGFPRKRGMDDEGNQ